MTIKKHIPNTITCCNLISGCIAIAFAFSGNIELSFTWIIIGAIFDFFDGMSARLLNVSSPIGKELDSLADVITFGVAPSTILFSKLSIMAYPPMFDSLRFVLPFAAYIMAAFSALRLAKFNLDERQTLGFIGLPTPAMLSFGGTYDWSRRMDRIFSLYVIFYIRRYPRKFMADDFRNTNVCT